MPDPIPVHKDTASLGVLHIVSGNSLAGVERHVLLLARTQRAMGMRVHIAFPRGGWLEEELRRSDIPYTPLPLRGTGDAVSLLKLLRIARRERLDIIHGHLIRGMFYAMAAGKLSGRASVGTDHLVHPNWVMRHLKRLIVLSRGSRDATLPGLRQDRIAVVPNGVDVERLEGDARDARRERAAWPVPEEAPAVCLLGRVVPVKGHDVLLRALALIPPAERPWTVFAGPEDPAWAAHLRDLAAELGVADRLAFLGPRANVGAVLAASTVVTVPSRMEACPLALLEALVLGLPTVSAAAGGITDLITDGENGLLVPPDDPQSLAVALERLLGDASLRRRLGETARADALERFTSEAMAESLRAVYLDALGRSGRYAPTDALGRCTRAE